MCQNRTISLLLLLQMAMIAVSGSLFAQVEAPSLKRIEASKALMGVKFAFVVYANNVEQAREGLVAAVERIETLNKSFSDYDQNSELSKLCRQAEPNKPAKVSSELMEVLQLADRIHRLSNGSFDPTIAPLTKLWRLARKSKKLPSEQQILAAKDRVGWEKIKLYPKSSSIAFAQTGVELDLGGIAKGYAADEAIRILRAKGLGRCLIDAGGDVTVGDAPPGKKGWKIAISNADGERLLLTNGSVATSGDRFQFLEHEGKKYSHIIDPRSGWGITNRRLVTVVTRLKNNRSGTMADGWASALSVMPLDLVNKKLDSVDVAGVKIQSLDQGDEKTVLVKGELVK